MIGAGVIPNRAPEFQIFAVAKFARYRVATFARAQTNVYRTAPVVG
jgi:hypothetical protein